MNDDQRKRLRRARRFAQLAIIRIQETLDGDWIELAPGVDNALSHLNDARVTLEGVTTDAPLPSSSEVCDGCHSDLKSTDLKTIVQLCPECAHQ